MKKFICKTWWLLLPLVITAVAVICGFAGYSDTVDDYHMNVIAESFKLNSHSEFLLYLNVYIGYLIKWLYGIIPAVNWYDIVYLFILNISFITIFKVIHHRGSHIFAILTVSVFMLYMLFTMTFTYFPFVCGCAAFLWVMEYADKLCLKSIKHLLYAFLLLLIGFGMRNGSVCTCLVMMFVPVFVFCIIRKQNSAAVIISLVVICLFSNYLTEVLQKDYISNIPDETYYHQFNVYRARATDDGLLSYDDTNKDIFEKAGLTKNDIDLFSQWSFADKNVFSQDALKAIAESRSTSQKYDFNVISIAVKMFLNPENMIIWFLIAAIICFVLNKKRRTEIIVFSVFVMGAVAYLYFRRRGVARVINPISINGIICLIYMYVSELDINKSIINKKNLLMYSLIICTFGLAFMMPNVYSTIKEKIVPANKSALIEYTSKHKDNVFLIDDATKNDLLLNNYKFSVRTHENGEFKNMDYIFGGAEIYTYNWYANLEKLGLSQYSDCTFKAVLDERVRLVTTTEYMKRIVTFLKEHYDLDVQYTVEDKEFADYPGLKVYNLFV